MKKSVKVVSGIIIVCLVITTAGVVFNMRNRSNKIAAGNARVSTIELGKTDITDSISATGEIESKRTKSVSADINGVTIKDMLVSVGDEVKKGDSLVKFDKSDLKEALSEAKSELKETKSSADKDIADAKTKYSEALETQSYEKNKADSSVAKAEKALKEAESALKQAKKNTDVNASEIIKAAEEAYKQAESELEKTKESRITTVRHNKSSVSQARSSVESAESAAKKSIKEAEKRVEEAQDNLDACAITSPIDGIVTAVNAESGDTYNGGTLVQIDDISGYKITTSVDEYDISNVKEGQRVVILTEATGEDELEGETTFVAPSKNSTSDTSGSSGSGNGSMGGSSSDSDGYEVKISVTTVDERLKLGMTARCSIILDERKDVYAVPYDAVNENPDGSCYIMVIDTAKESDDKSEENIRKVEVTKGMDTDYYVEINGDKLKEGMKVIVPTDEVSEQDSDSDSKGSFSGFGGLDVGSGRPGGVPGGEHGGAPGESRGNEGSSGGNKR